jgi:hypothetical protein
MLARPSKTDSFNPVLGFLSVSTSRYFGFVADEQRFQSRAGFSECLDTASIRITRTNSSFNPVLGFLSVSTSSNSIRFSPATTRFNPVLGFLSVSTGDQSGGVAAYSGFNPVLGFLSVST